MRHTTLLIPFVAASLVSAQSVTIEAKPRVEVRRDAPRVVINGQNMSWSGEDDDRPMIGVSTSSSGKRDTLGLLISSVTEGGPAEKAGLEEGWRIQSINGVSLRMSKDDAEEPEMAGVMQRRLVREIGKTKAGEAVSLQVWNGSASRTVKVTPVEAEELSPRRTMRESRAAMNDRAVLGISLGSTGSKRDTLGIFVSGVTEGGPAEKAGIVEGERIAAINGVKLTMTKDDLEDGWIASSRSNRLTRELRKAKAGDVVDLTVVSGGRSRSVKVTTAKSSELEKLDGGRRSMYFFNDGGGRMGITIPPMPPMPPMSGMRSFSFDGDDKVELERAMGRLREILPQVRGEVRRAPVVTRTTTRSVRI